MSKLTDVVKILGDHHENGVSAINNISPRTWSTSGYMSYQELMDASTTEEQNAAFSDLYKDEKESGAESALASQIAQRVQLATIAAIRRGYRMKMVSGPASFEYSRYDHRRREFLNRRVAEGKLKRLSDNKSVNPPEAS